MGTVMGKESNFWVERAVTGNVGKRRKRKAE
jgi:hypothetical protein